MSDLLDTAGRIVSIAVTAAFVVLMVVVFAANERDLWLERRDARRARSQFPIGDRFRQPPGGWSRRR